MFIRGTRIRAEILYGYHINAEDPWTAQEIADDYGLPLEAVEEAIAFCRSAPPEVAEDRARERRLAEASGMLDPDYKYHPYPKLLSAQELARLRDP